MDYQTKLDRQLSIEDAIIDKVTAILGLTELVLLKNPEDPFIVECLEKARNAARDLNNLVYEMAELSHEPEQHISRDFVILPS